MKELILKNYINKLTKEHIINFSKNEGVILTHDETNYIYNTIKENYREILHDPTEIFLCAKRKLRPEVYDRMIELYEYYKRKFNLF